MAGLQEGGLFADLFLSLFIKYCEMEFLRHNML